VSGDLLAAIVPDTGVVLRSQVLAWPEAGGVGCWLDGVRVHVPVEWPLDRVELTSAARWLAAWGDHGRRLRVWRSAKNRVPRTGSQPIGSQTWGVRLGESRRGISRASPTESTAARPAR
jgi:hypothetical protein